MQTYIEPALSQEEGRALWRAMSDEVNAKRLMAPATGRALVKLAVLFPLLGATLAAAWMPGALWVSCTAYVCIALLLGQFAFVGHDAGHGAVGIRSAVNRSVGQIAMTLVTGLAFDEWIERHRAHHRYCQDEERDPDMMVDLVVSLTEKSRRRKGWLGRFMTRHQAVHIWLLSLLFGHSQRLLSQAAVIRHPRRFALDAVLLILHFGLWFGIPCLLLNVPLQTALLAYMVPLTILGPHLAAIFWVNHVGMPLIDKVERFSFFEHQLMTSRTIVNPRSLDWLFGGLNFQIEHHLFPQVPSSRLVTVQPIVRRHLDAHGIAYQGVSWWCAIRSIASHLRRVAHER